MTTQTIMPGPATSEKHTLHNLTISASTSMTISQENTSEFTMRLLDVSVLAQGCKIEMEKYRRGEPHSDQYCVELLHRALVQRDNEAWDIFQQCFTETMQRWMHSHRMYDLACRHDSEENYIAQAFARFWIATALHQRVAFPSLAAALRYLRTSLNAAILDTLRAYARSSKELPLLEHEGPEDPSANDDDAQAVWEVVRSLLPNEREQRVAYLLFHCGLKPRQVLKHCPGEFSDIQEIYRLRHNITDRLARNADLLRWRLGDGTH
ncbi:MAG: sigma-70 family RNA polymerase sigma factor [Ktedonobacteraceae bacterium]|nr:sigma-70 family RNA polymerase sigma factor [Ktedonobacteraceae bacterium]